jgi:hypothetical protein
LNRLDFFMGVFAVVLSPAHSASFFTARRLRRRSRKKPTALAPFFTVFLHPRMLGEPQAASTLPHEPTTPQSNQQQYASNAHQRILGLMLVQGNAGRDAAHHSQRHGLH